MKISQEEVKKLLNRWRKERPKEFKPRIRRIVKEGWPRGFLECVDDSQENWVTWIDAAEKQDVH